MPPNLAFENHRPEPSVRRRLPPATGKRRFRKNGRKLASASGNSAELAANSGRNARRGRGDVMLRKQRKGWIAAGILAAILLASAPAAAAGPARRDTESWFVRMARWLGLPSSVTAVWEKDSANIDPNGQPKPTGSAGS